VPALPSCLTEPIWEQIQALLPDHHDDHPLRCHRPRVPDRVVFDLLINALVFGAGYRRIADERCSATTLRRRRDEWIAAGVMDRLAQLARDGYDKLIGLELHDLAVDGCSTKAPCGGEVAGRNPTDRGKLGIKRSTLTDAGGLPLGVITAPANRHDHPLLAPPSTPSKISARCPKTPACTSTPATTPTPLANCSPSANCAGRSPAKASPPRSKPPDAGRSNVSHAWHNNFYKLARCTERRQIVADFYIALANTVILIRRLLRRAWTLYRWDTRPPRRP
jgi:transposase